MGTPWGALHLQSNSRDVNDGTSFPAMMKSSTSGNRNQTVFRVRNSRVILVISMLVSCAYQPLTPVAADGIRSLSQSAESESELDFTLLKLISGRCSKESYADGSNYAYNVEAVLTKLAERINAHLEVWEDASDFYDNLDTVYGVAGCTDLSAMECRLCLAHIVTHLEDWCPHHALKAEITLNFCFLKYDNYYIKVPLRVPLLGSRIPDHCSCTKGAALSI